MTSIEYDIVTQQYGKLGTKDGIVFSEEELYLSFEFNAIAHHQGWILYVPFNYTETKEALSAIVPILITNNLNFKVVKNAIIHKKMNNGTYGKTMIGRNIVIKLDEISKSDSIVSILNPTTEVFKGPVLGYDYKLGVNLYARYGSYNSKIVEDEIGNLERLVMDSSGKWFRDKYRRPPLLPYGIKNPFDQIITSTSTNGFHTTLRGNYKIGDPLYRDIWGSVYEGSSLNDSSSASKYYIFRGKRKTFIDDFNRDTYDRLEWAAKTISHLKISTLQVIDFWKEDEYAFLILSRTEGKSLEKLSSELLDDTLWSKSAVNVKKKIINILIKIAKELANINSLGYINRQINCNSVFVSPSLDITIIGWDLSYDFVNKIPSPPFQTKEELNTSSSVLPDENTDLNSYGNLAVSVLSGHSNVIITAGESEESISKKINYITDNSLLTNIISKCIQNSEASRPTWTEIIETLEVYNNSLDREKIANKVATPYTNTILAEIIQSALHELASQKLTIKNLWFSLINHPYDTDVYPQGNKHIFPSIYRGISGILYLLARSSKVGFDISHLSDKIEDSLNFIIDRPYKKSNNLSSGLYYGAAGISVALNEMVNSQLLPMNSNYGTLIEHCLSGDNALYDVINGVAGDGLATLICKGTINNAFYEERTANTATKLLRTQQTSGAWLSPNRRPNDMINGFGYGTAGICYFLLEYAERHGSKDALHSAIAGITYLNSLKIDSDQICWWPSSTFDQRRGFSWCFGSAGIALTYLKAYEYTHDLDYLNTAEKALRSLNPYKVLQNFSPSTGLSGIGEVYLEAFRISRAEEWYERATIIIDAICNLGFNAVTTKTHRNTNTVLQTADFMTGQTGILHFLLRYQHPDKISYPLLPPPINHP